MNTTFPSAHLSVFEIVLTMVQNAKNDDDLELAKKVASKATHLPDSEKETLIRAFSEKVHDLTRDRNLLEQSFMHVVNSKPNQPVPRVPSEDQSVAA